MKRELIDLLDEIRKIGNRSAQLFISDIAYDKMDAEQWEQLQDALKSVNLKSQEAFLLSADLRRKVAA